MQSSDDNGTFEPLNVTTINNYNITSTQGIYDDINDVTTFSYSVNYAGSGPSSNNFYLEIPKCAVDQLIPESLTSPSGNSIVYPYDDPRSGTTGVLWNSSLSRRTSHFSISFNGNVTNGKVSATVISGNRGATGEIAGPCKGNEEEVEMFEVSGFVFVDVDANSFKNNYETGIPNVVVRLFGNGVDDTIFTDISGRYSFTVPANSNDYVLSIPRTIGDVEFNTKFYESYDFTGSADNINLADEPEVNVSVTNDGASFDFPFSANTDNLILQFEEQTIFTNTRDFDFWRSMVRHAANQTSGDVEVPQEKIYEYLDRIERNDFFTKYLGNLLPDVPFKFVGETDAEKAAYALEVYLFNPSDQKKTPLQIFLRELLVAELNIVSGIYGVAGFEVDGLNAECQGGTVQQAENGKFYCNANTEEFHLALLAYGEGLAAQFMQLEIQKLSTSSISSISLSDGTQVFSTFNRTGSGGLGF
ncbi:MAG: hypothetical protein ACNA8K_01510 [Cyclonatronaceae bacterium]